MSSDESDPKTDSSSQVKSDDTSGNDARTNWDDLGEDFFRQNRRERLALEKYERNQPGYWPWDRPWENDEEEEEEEEEGEAESKEEPDKLKKRKKEDDDGDDDGKKRKNKPDDVKGKANVGSSSAKTVKKRKT
ncbi:hypothetical protein RND81_07G184200 [Saponaria officinalis]|uniref:Uncharacterized protein n=1 Tax=Saponaria officinalis TaxID=3572 RepID=A0AAW1JTJ4_SAPOF